MRSISDSIIIDLKGIYKEYHLGDQTVPVLRDVNLQIARGEFVAIMGTSGSGKSTLMNMLGCLDRPTAGEYSLNGIRVDTLDDMELSYLRNREIGFVFQNFNLLADSNALQNIALPLLYRGIPRKKRQSLAFQAAERMGIIGRIKHRPNELSGGQAQRVAIARALLGKPGIILADEPTGNLDSRTGKEIMEIFKDLHCQGHSIIMVTHDKKLAQIADRIIYISDGKIINDEQTADNPPKKPAQAQPPVKLEDPVQLAEKGGLRWLDLFSLSIREGLFTHPLRTFLTMLGVLFGVAAVIAMVAINEGARQKAIEQIRQMGLNNIRIRSLQMTKEEAREAREKLSMGLNLKDVEVIQKIPSIEYLAPIRHVNAEISFGLLKPRGQILGTLPAYQKVANFYAARGRFINQSDMKNYRRVCVLGESIKTEIFANQKALGRLLYLGSEIFTVVGIMESKNAPQGVVKAVSSNDVNHNIYIPLSTAKKRFNKTPTENELSEISVKVDHSNRVQPTARLLANIISRRHNNVNDFEIVVPEELLRQEQKTQEIFDIIMVSIASISLLVGGIGIMNIMLATVTERIQEIGVRRAVGANMQDILKQFLVEAAIISMMGGIVGIFCGWVFTILISTSTGWQTVVSMTSVVLGFGVASLVGIIFGIYPAWKAALLDPIKALNTI